MYKLLRGPSWPDGKHYALRVKSQGLLFTKKGMNRQLKHGLTYGYVYLDMGYEQERTFLVLTDDHLIVGTGHKDHRYGYGSAVVQSRELDW